LSVNNDKKSVDSCLRVVGKLGIFACAETQQCDFSYDANVRWTKFACHSGHCEYIFFAVISFRRVYQYSPAQSVAVLVAGFKKTRVFFKKAQPSGFFGFYWVLGFYWVFLDKQEK